MNLSIIKEDLNRKLGRQIIVTEHGMRNRKSIYEGTLYKLYPNIFSIMTRNGEKSFSYSDIATKSIVIKYK